MFLFSKFLLFLTCLASICSNETNNFDDNLWLSKPSTDPNVLQIGLFSPSFSNSLNNFNKNAKMMINLIKEVSYLKEHGIFFGLVYNESLNLRFYSKDTHLNSRHNFKVDCKYLTIKSAGNEEINCSGKNYSKDDDKLIAIWYF